MLLAALLLVAQTSSEQPAPPSDDIVVAAERLKRFRAVTRKDRKTGVTRCVIKRRSGDPVLDSGVCAALLACAAKITKESEIRACMEPAILALLPKAQWEAKRARD